jgi:hypothetical protein
MPSTMPEEFICPLTLDIMKEPIMTRWGHNYEREALMKWMERHDDCPLTRNALTLQDIIVNRALKQKIEQWQTDSGIEVFQHEVDQKLPFFVSVKSNKTIIRALARNNDPSGQCALKALQRERRREKRRRKRAAAA